MQQLVINVDEGGRARFVYDDEWAELLDLGESRIRRASHVEPDDDGRWWADLAPVNGPKLGPFERRGLAIAAEVEWINAKGLVTCE